MIFSYSGHQSVKIQSGKISVIGTSSPVIYNEIICGLNDFNDNVKLFDDSYNKLEISKYIDFDTSIVFNHKLYDKYSRYLIMTVIDNMTEISRKKIDRDIQELYSSIQESLFMTDLPIEVTYDGDLKRIINYSHMHFAFNRTLKPYDIIINDLKIHLECNLKSIVCFSNLANFLSKEEFTSLLSEVNSMQIPLLLVEFTELNNMSFYQNADALFIDQDFVDWKE